jgi:hypothetical protein
MKKKKIILITGIGLLSIGSLSAQGIKRQTISPVGGNGSAGAVYIQQTAGQSFNTNSYSGGEFSIRQGFQQPSVFNAEIIENIVINLGLYPNPAKYSVTLESDVIIAEATISVTDIAGKLIYIENQENFSSKIILCNDWQNGTYLITVVGDKGEKSTSKLIINK